MCAIYIVISESNIALIGTSLQGRSRIISSSIRWIYPKKRSRIPATLNPMKRLIDLKSDYFHFGNSHFIICIHRANKNRLAYHYERRKTHKSMNMKNHTTNCRTLLIIHRTTAIKAVHPRSWRNLCHLLSSFSTSIRSTCFR